MEAREYLEQYQRKKRQIDRLYWTIEELKSMAEGTPYRMDGMPHGSGLKNPMEIFLTDAIDKEKELRQMIEEAQNTLIDIEETIDEIKEPELSDLLYYRYIQGLQWSGSKYYINKSKSPYIKDKLGYDDRHLRRLHYKALEKVQKIIDKKNKMSANVRLN